LRGALARGGRCHGGRCSGGAHRRGAALLAAIPEGSVHLAPGRPGRGITPGPPPLPQQALAAPLRPPAWHQAPPPCWAWSTPHASRRRRAQPPARGCSPCPAWSAQCSFGLGRVVHVTWAICPLAHPPRLRCTTLRGLTRQSVPHLPGWPWASLRSQSARPWPRPSGGAAWRGTSWRPARAAPPGRGGWSRRHWARQRWAAWRSPSVGSVPACCPSGAGMPGMPSRMAGGHLAAPPIGGGEGTLLWRWPLGRQDAQGIGWEATAPVPSSANREPASQHPSGASAWPRGRWRPPGAPRTARLRGDGSEDRAPGGAHETCAIP
jgi:hypothetical protein